MSVSSRAVIRMGPVAKTRNSTLTLKEHQTFLTLARKKQRFENKLEDARPLTADERQSLLRLEPLVRAEQVGRTRHWASILFSSACFWHHLKYIHIYIQQAKYNEALKKWVEGSRSPYRLLDKSISGAVDAFITELKEEQKAMYPKHYQHHIVSTLIDPSGAPLLPEPGFLVGVKTATPSAKTIHIPDLPFDIK